MPGLKKRYGDWSLLLQPRALAGRPEGLAFAVLCAASLGLIGLADLNSAPSVTVGSFEVVPLLAAAWLLGDRLLVAVAATAILLRLAIVYMGALEPLSATAQVATVPFVAVVGRTAAVAVKRAREQATRESLVSTVTGIASSAGSLQEILDRILHAIAREGMRGGTIALIDERDRLYIAAAEGQVDPEVMAIRLPVGQGIMGRVAATGEPVLVDDLREAGAPASPTREVGNNAEIRSIAAVPLRAAGRVIGVLEIDSTEPGRFDETDLVLLGNISLAVSGTVLRAGALQLADAQVKRRVHELSILLDAAQRMASSLDDGDLMETICRSGAEIAFGDADAGRRSNLIRVRESQGTVIADFDELGQNQVGYSFQLDDHPGVAGACRTGLPTTCTLDDLEGAVRAAAERAGLQSFAYAPVRVGASLWGILAISTRDRLVISAADLRLLQGVADLAGLAIANAELLNFERTRSEHLQEHAERMAALDHAKSEFLRLASHELRGPLGVLRGYISMLAEGELGALPREAERVMAILTGKVSEINMLIEQMLETARLEDSRLQLVHAQHDLREVVQEAVSTIQPLLGERHRLDLELPERPVPASVDRARVATIITNLLDNAVKYSPDGGAITVRLTADDGSARISVEDRGIGIDAADMSRLFTRFGRLVTRDNSHIPGTGLGLYLSRELARMHDGDIVVRSVPGQGSTFVLSLPVISVAAPAASA